MTHKKLLGIIFANVHDEFLPDLTVNRSMASIPFGGRYRLIDFPLSCLVNAGVSTVGIIPKVNYHSLMDHIGSGKAWDLDRKSGGIFILPPYLKARMSTNPGHIESLDSIMEFLKKSKEEDIILCDADVVGNIDIRDMYQNHKEKGADISIAYKKGVLPHNKGDVMAFETEPDGRITKIMLPRSAEKELSFSLDIVIMKRELVIKLVNEAMENNSLNMWKDIFMPKVNELKFYGYGVSSPIFVIDSKESYAEANFALLNPEIRREIFTPSRPIYTKVRDDVPAKYGLSAVTCNSLVADGCIIEGTVKNSILFRGAKVMKGAVVENSIIMQDTVIEENAALNYVITDKNVVITKDTDLKGAVSHFMYISKSTKV